MTGDPLGLSLESLEGIDGGGVAVVDGSVETVMSGMSFPRFVGQLSYATLTVLDASTAISAGVI